MAFPVNKLHLEMVGIYDHANKNYNKINELRFYKTMANEFMLISKTEKKLLHYTGKAIADFNLIQTGDRVLVCLSGGKDSFTLLKILRLLQIRSNNKFSI